MWEATVLSIQTPTTSNWQFPNILPVGQIYPVDLLHPGYWMLGVSWPVIEFRIPGPRVDLAIGGSPQAHTAMQTQQSTATFHPKTYATVRTWLLAAFWPWTYPASQKQLCTATQSWTCTASQTWCCHLNTTSHAGLAWPHCSCCWLHRSSLGRA